MSNVIYEDKFYNEDIKLKFMENYSEGTKKILERLFKISYILEAEYEKDLYSFNREELRRLGYEYRPKSTYSSRVYIAWLQKYIDWAIEEGYHNGINPLELVSTEWKEQFVVKVKKYWTKFEIDSIFTKLENYQDIVIASLLFNGVRGKGNSEILNLKKQDIDADNNRLHVVDEDGGERWVYVDDSCIQYCLKAYNETEYEKKNGDPDPEIRSRMGQLVENEYIVRSVKTRTTHFDKAEKNIVHRRLSAIAKLIDEPNFTPINLYHSGMLYLASELYKTTGKLEKEEYDLIFSKERYYEPSEQTRYQIKTEFLNEEVLFELYPELKKMK
jgi:integrase